MMTPNEIRRAALAAALLAPLLTLTACSDDGPEEASGGAAAAAHESASKSTTSGAATGTQSHPRTMLDVDVRMIPAPDDVAADTPAMLMGVARIDGPVPNRQTIETSHIPGCRDFSGQQTETVIATEDGLLKNVFVYVADGLDRSTFGPVPEEPVTLEQSLCVFRPHIVVLRAGQTLRVTNEDPTNHSVRAVPQHISNKAFNTVQPMGGEALEVVFPQAEPGIRISCDLHAWMRAYVHVVDHSYYDISDEGGNWAIEVPPGRYVVEAWHEELGTRKVAVTLGPGEKADLGFVFETKQRKKRKNP